VANNIKSKSCMNPECKLHGKANEGNIRTHGWYKTKTSRRRRYTMPDATFLTCITKHLRMHIDRTSYRISLRSSNVIIISCDHIRHYASVQKFIHLL